MDKCPLCNSRLHLGGVTKSAGFDPNDSNIIIQKESREQTCACSSSPDNEFKPCPNYGIVLDTITTETRIPIASDVKAFAEKVVIEQYNGNEAMILATKLADKAVQGGGTGAP
jgi:hypothetical protein